MTTTEDSTVSHRSLLTFPGTYANARFLPVPVPADPSGRVFMGPHFELAASRTGSGATTTTPQAAARCTWARSDARTPPPQTAAQLNGGRTT
jgi:hypothetical protein